MKTLSIMATFVLLFICSSDCFAWGVGHHDHARLVLKELPTEIVDFFPKDIQKQIIGKNCKLPDSSTKFDADFMAKVGPSAEKLLKKCNILGSYPLHSPEGLAVSFVLMAEAFQGDKPGLAGLWAGSLLHVVADEGACTHGPFCGYIGFLGNYNGVVTQKKMLELSIFMKRADFRKKVDALLANYQPEMISDKPEDAVVAVMLEPFKLNRYMTKREARISGFYSEDKKRIEDADLAMAEIAAEETKVAANMIYTAWKLAKAGKTPALTDEVIAKYKAESRKFLEAQQLSDDSIYGEFAKNEPKFPGVGVLLENSVRMNRCRFGFSSKFILSAMMNELDQAAFPVIPLSISKLEKGGLLSPEQMPLLVVCSGRARFSKNAISKIRDYVNSGGKILWVGGNEHKLMGELSQSLRDLDKKFQPFRRRFGDNNLEVIKNASFAFSGGLEKSLGEKNYKLTGFKGKASWCRPYSPYKIEAVNEKIKTFCVMDYEGEKINVAGGLLEENGKLKHAFIPEYLLTPTFFAEQYILEDPAKPELDKFGEKVFIETVKMMVPEITGKTIDNNK